MSIDFGVVSKYIGERGFGFVRGQLLENSPEYFFHIRVVKKVDLDLAKRLSDTPLEGDIHFWFETEETPKGKQVRAIFSSEQVRQGAISDTSDIIKKIESLWKNLKHPKPSWLGDVTSDLAGKNRADELQLEREHLEYEEKAARELARQRYEIRLKAQEEKRQRELEARMAQKQLKDDEFQALVSEIKPHEFTHSSQVSNYITANNLGNKYPNISGILQMESNGKTWNFKSGFPPDIYAKLCRELGLSNNGTRAKAVAFESYSQIQERTHKK